MIRGKLLRIVELMRYQTEPGPEVCQLAREIWDECVRSAPRGSCCNGSTAECCEGSGHSECRCARNGMSPGTAELAPQG